MSTHATPKTTNHNQLTYYISSTVDTNMATSTTSWHYLNISIVFMVTPCINNT